MQIKKSETTTADCKQFARVAGIQAKLAAAGWRWAEETFANGDVIIAFTLDPDRLAFDNDAPYRWGRFTRLDAWARAYQFLVLELGPDDAIARLQEYKAKSSFDFSKS